MKLSRIEEALIERRRRGIERRKAAKKPRQRQERVRDTGFLAYLRRLPCVAGMVKGGCSGPVEAAHIRFSDAAHGRVNPGMQRKPSDRWATPLCQHHHQHDQHLRNERGFWADLGVEPGELSTDLLEAFVTDADPLAVLRRHVGKDGAS